MSDHHQDADDIARHARRRPAGRRGAGHTHARTSSPASPPSELDRLRHDYIVERAGHDPGAAELPPPGYTPYPKTICTSVNHVVCHGIPNDKPLKNGDIVNIDVTVIKDGWHGDTSRMFFVGEASIAAKRLCEITYEAMWRGIGKVQARRAPGRHRPRDPDSFAEKQRLLGGARVLRPRHRPQLPRGAAGAALRPARHAARSCKPGMTFTIEPMINAGKRDIREIGRRLDRRHQGPLAVGAVGAHGAGHRDRLRGADAVGRQPAAAGLRRRGRRAADRGRRRLPRAPPPADAARACATRCKRAARRELLALAAQLRAAPRAAPTRCCAALARAASTTRCATLWARRRTARRTARWWPSAATAAASCSRIPTSTCWCCCPTARARRDARAGRASKRFISSCWDIGLEIGSQRAHASTNACARRAADVTVQTACSKRACSPATRALFAELPRALHARRSTRRPSSRAKTLEMRQRHAKYEDTPYTLEPNCKESPGGLRDLQVILWVARAAGLGQHLGRAGRAAA